MSDDEDEYNFIWGPFSLSYLNSWEIVISIFLSVLFLLFAFWFVNLINIFFWLFLVFLIYVAYVISKTIKFDEITNLDIFSKINTNHLKIYSPTYALITGFALMLIFSSINTDNSLALADDPSSCNFERPSSSDDYPDSYSVNSLGFPSKNGEFYTFDSGFLAGEIFNIVLAQGSVGDPRGDIATASNLCYSAMRESRYFDDFHKCDKIRDVLYSNPVLAKTYQQSEIYKKISMEEPDGYYENCFSNGYVKEKYFLKDRSYDRFHTVYFDNGQLKSNKKYKNGDLKPGTYDEFYKDGQLSYRSSTNKEGQLDGLEQIYYKNGQLQVELYPENDIYNGPYEGFHENGQLQVRGTFDNVSRDDVSGDNPDFDGGFNIGDFEQYYDNGQLKIKETRIKDTRPEYSFQNWIQGFKFVYHKNGQLDFKQLYEIGERADGDTTFYHDNGQIRLTKKFVNDKLADGRYFEYYANGKLHKTYGSKDAKFFDTYLELDRDGKIKIIKCYTQLYNNKNRACDKNFDNAGSDTNYKPEEIFGRPTLKITLDSDLFAEHYVSRRKTIERYEYFPGKSVSFTWTASNVDYCELRELEFYSSNKGIKFERRPISGTENFIPKVQNYNGYNNDRGVELELSCKNAVLEVNKEVKVYLCDDECLNERKIRKERDKEYDIKIKKQEEAKKKNKELVKIRQAERKAIYEAAALKRQQEQEKRLEEYNKRMGN
jgi:antitoxin component YwqK of YwqJK toxin-antitoxin module